MRNSSALVVLAAAAFGQLPPSDQRVADLTQLIERKPDFAAAYYARGVLQLGAGQYMTAEQDFSKAIELRPDAAAYASRAQVYAATKRYDQEIADLSQAIGLKPGNLSYYLHRADAYRAKGDCEPAIADYSEVIRRAPSEAAYSGRAACRTQSGDAAGAADDERAIEQMKAGNVPPVPFAPIPSPPPRGVVPTGVGGGIGSGRGGGEGWKLPAAGPSPVNVYRIGRGVSQPSILFKIEPEYSEEARRAKWQGPVTLSVVVSEFGEVTDVKVLRSLGLGLDEEATEAVQKWVFKPGQKDGQPVAVYATIQVTFHLL